MKKLPPSKESITRRFDLGEELETDFGDNDQSAAPLRALDVSTTSRADTAYVMEAALPGEIEHPEAFRPTINATEAAREAILRVAETQILEERLQNSGQPADNSPFPPPALTPLALEPEPSLPPLSRKALAEALAFEEAREKQEKNPEETKIEIPNATLPLGILVLISICVFFLVLNCGIFYLFITIKPRLDEVTASAAEQHTLKQSITKQNKKIADLERALERILGPNMLKEVVEPPPSGQH
jgi:hypothetical protein